MGLYNILLLLPKELRNPLPLLFVGDFLQE